MGRTCSEEIGSRHGVSKDGNFAIDYQIGFDRYECLIDGAPKHDTVYTCESVPYDRCFGGDFFQISNDGNDDMSFAPLFSMAKRLNLPLNLADNRLAITLRRIIREHSSEDMTLIRMAA